MLTALRSCGIVLSFPLFMALSGAAVADSHATGDDCGDADMAAMKTWFPVDQVADPGTKLPSDTLCAFHVWSTQMFLWLTATDPDTDQMRFLGMSNLEELFEPTGVDKLARSKAMLQLRPRVSKDGQPDLSEIMQAGSRGLLVDQDGNIVYYEQLFNDAFVEFTQSKFFTGGAFDPTKMAAATGLTDYFPSGVMELKASWKIMSDNDNMADFLTVDAEVYTLTIQDNQIVVSDQTAVKTVGLVGLHIAATVDDHPEMIWATFEHQGNSPDLAHGTPVTSTDPVSAENFTFYAANTPVNKSNVNAKDLLILDENNGTLNPVTNVFRQFASGTTVGGKDWELNLADIKAVNDFWQANFAPSGSAIKNYFEVGSVWMTPNSLSPNEFPMDALRGSTILSNSTMETYTQADQQCFSCHNSLQVTERVGGVSHTLPGTNFNISHALVMEYFRTVAQGQGVKVRALR